MSDGKLPVSRRGALVAGAVSVASLAGCSTMDSDDGSTSLDQIVARSNTDQTERVELTLAYSPRDSPADQPVRGIYEVPAVGEPLVVDEFEGRPGFYNLTVFSEYHNTHGTYTVNSFSSSVESVPFQLEVLVQEDGGFWINLGEAGSQISLPE